MACIHGLSPRDCQHLGCSTSGAAIEESDPSASGTNSSKESDSSEGDESSDEVEIVVDDMRSTNLGGLRQKLASKKGM